MIIQRLDGPAISAALARGWAIYRATSSIGSGVTAVVTLVGLAILGGLVWHGFTPFVIAAAGGFMLLGPVLLAGFFGLAAAHEQGRRPAMSDFLGGFGQASRGIWAIALVCGLLFMIFVTDAAILYSYMVGATPVWLGSLPADGGVGNFVFWGMISGFAIAFMLFSVSAFSVPLLCERRAGLVDAVVTSVRVVFGNFTGAMTWAALLAVLMMGSALLLPALPVTLPWLAFASRALYRHVLPPSRQA